MLFLLTHFTLSLAGSPAIVISPYDYSAKANLIGASMLVAQGGGVNETPNINPSMNQDLVTIEDVARLVYEKVPNLPLENQYTVKETGKNDPNNTLVMRMIRYHLYVKGRPPVYRYDWKITLADYLGITPDLVIDDSSYPGADVLKVNPLAADRTAITRLQRSQRDALVQTLVDIFNGNNTGMMPRQQRNPGDRGLPPTNNSLPIPQPGDAELLR